MPDSEQRRQDPEQILRQVEAEARSQARGQLKVFLGYASGVGKSFRMFDEGRRRKERGEDIVVAAAQPEVSAGMGALLSSSETIPMRTDLSAPVVDVLAVLKRRPQVCIIDGLAFDNPAGARNRYRWQDVEELLAAGISVLTSVNIHYIQELQPRIEAIRGKVVRDSVPQAFIKTADEIEVVDAPPEYAATRSRQRDENPQKFAKQLSELREIALLLAAEVVDYQLEQYMQRQGIDEHYGIHERVLVCVTPRSNAAVMIRRGRRQADRFHGDLHIVYVEQEEMNVQDRNRIEENLSIAREVHAHVEVLHGNDPVQSILRYAAEHGITQIFLGHSQRQGWLDRLRANPVERIILDAEAMDVRIFPNQDPVDHSLNA
jgi:two-component system sensor histidine kinase KdpD